MASLNPFRRRTQTLLSSAETVDLASYSSITAVLKKREEWQKQSRDAFHGCGEIANACTHLADLMSRIVLFAAEQPDDKDAKPQRSTDASAISTVERLGTITDISQLLYDLTLLLLVVGEAQLLGIQPGEGRDNTEEIWIAIDKDELDTATISDEEGNRIDTVKIKDYKDGTPLLLDPRKRGRDNVGDTWIRIWRSDPFAKQKAFSHVRPLLGAIDELGWWDHAASSVAKNRQAITGMVGVPSNLELTAEAGEPAGLSGGQRFIRRMFNSAIKTIQNPGLSSGAVPNMFTYPWNESGKSGVEILEWQRPQDELLEKRTDRSLRRIAQGFPLPVESFFGLGDTTFGGGRSIEEAKFRDNVEPFILFVVSCLTKAWYRPIRLAEGAENASKAILWYDASNLIVKPDITQAADKGVEYNAINLAAWRRVRGFSERDAPTPEESAEMLEWLRALRGKGATQDGQSPSDIGPDDEPADELHDPKDHTPTPKKATPVRGKGQPVLASANGHSHSSLGRRLAEIDADLLSRVQVMADSAMRREQERAGNKLKLRASKNTRIKQTIKGVAATDIASTLGREIVVTLGLNDLFSDAFENIPEQFMGWCDRASISAFEVAGLSPSVMQANADFQLSYAVTEASDLLVRDLRELALTLLFDRAASLGPSPESDDLLVPASIVRRALNRAGGNASPSLLLATGHAVAKVLGSQAGLYANSFSFWWTPKPRSPFSRHQDLDGQTCNLDTMADRFNDTNDCSCIAIPVF